MRRTKRIYGEIDGYPVGTSFTNRGELTKAGVHRPLQAGICDSGTEPAESIFVSGGYEDDSDSGNTIVYTGHGGNDLKTKKQVADQVLERGNAALALNKKEGIPVRVVRGYRNTSPFAPATGYRYDGIYSVEDYWQERGKSGFMIWRFRLKSSTQDGKITTREP